VGVGLQQADVLFLSDMAKYMKNDPAVAAFPHATLNHLMWWSWNPNSGDTGGIVQDDWLTVRCFRFIRNCRNCMSLNSCHDCPT